MRSIDTVERNIYYHCLEYDHDQMGDLFMVACGVEECDPGVTYGPDLRDCYHLHIVKEGRGVLRAGGGNHPVHEGQMFILKHNETVSYTADREEPWHYCWVTFGGTAAKEFVEKMGFSEGVYCLDCRTDPQRFYDLIKRMYLRPEMNIVGGLYRRGIMMEFLALAMESVDPGLHRTEKRAVKPIEQYIKMAEDFINYNYATINVADVLRFVNFSRSYFSNAFHKKTGMTIQEYLLRARMERAKHMLRETDLGIGLIAQNVGYEDQLHFSRNFRKYTGMSPTAYRAEEV